MSSSNSQTNSITYCLFMLNNGYLIDIFKYKSTSNFDIDLIIDLNSHEFNGMDYEIEQMYNYDVILYINYG